MYKNTFLLFFFFLLQINFSLSQTTIEIPSSFNPLGSGARAIGMGGAFIAVADDATAASWNPAGLVQLEKSEFSIVETYLHRKEKLKFGTNPDSNSNQSTSENDINYLSLTFCFSLLNRNMTFSLNYQNLFDMNKEWNFRLKDINHYEYSTTKIIQDIDFEQQGLLSAAGFAYSLEISPKFSFGFTFNFWSDDIFDNGWEKNTNVNGEYTIKSNNTANTYQYYYSNKEKFSFEGFNINIGFLWDISDKFTLGGVLKTPFTADIKHESYYYDNYSTLPTFEENTHKLDMPMSYGFGLSYRMSDQLTFSMDIYRTNWNSFKLRYVKDNKEVEICPIADESDQYSVTTLSDIDLTNQIRIGAEYLYINKEQKYIIPFRFGIFYDPAPANKNPDDYFGFSFGTGFSKEPVSFDIAFQYRTASDVNSDILNNLEFSQNNKEITIYSSMIYHY